MKDIKKGIKDIVDEFERLHEMGNIKFDNDDRKYLKDQVISLLEIVEQKQQDLDAESITDNLGKLQNLRINTQEDYHRNKHTIKSSFKYKVTDKLNK